VTEVEAIASRAAGAEDNPAELAILAREARDVARTTLAKDERDHALLVSRALFRRAKALRGEGGK
jgi:hypothetical protein